MRCCPSGVLDMLFRCLRSGNVIECNDEQDIQSLLKEPGYSKIQLKGDEMASKKKVPMKKDNMPMKKGKKGC